MNPPDSLNRYNELLAGRAFGDLTLEEERELALLSKQSGISPDADLELLATALALDPVLQRTEPMPAGLAARLHQKADMIGLPGGSPIIYPQVPAWKNILLHPMTGWAAAAAVVILSFVLTQTKAPLPLDQAAAYLRSVDKNLIERRFVGLGEFKQAAGQVLWSDAQQRGFMILTGIPANDPRKAQYQLWIVDPTRDSDAPVDGGVFDIPSNGSPVVVPIAAKLALSNPQAFVITREHPGGVVKSKQEHLVALAKN
jgi:hypothetical protein